MLPLAQLHFKVYDVKENLLENAPVGKTFGIDIVLPSLKKVSLLQNLYTSLKI